MGRQDWEHDLMEQILSLMQFLQENGISMDCSTGPEALKLLENSPALWTACEMLRFMDEIPGGFMIYRADGDERIIYVNRGLLHIFLCDDWSQFSELTGGSFRGLVYPEDLQEVEKSIWRQIASSQYDLDYVEYRIIRRDGTLAWIEDYGHFVHSESVGDFFYVFLGDATEKRERQRSEREQAEQRYQGLIQEYDRERTLINQEHLRRLEVIEGLSVNYESILYAELERNRILAYRLSQRTTRQFGEKYQMKELRWYLTDYVDVWVHPEDKEMVARETAPDYIREELKKNETYYINYRVICQGEVQYLQLRIVNVGAGDQVDQIVLGYRRVDEEIQREMQQKQILAEALENANLAITAKNEFLSNMSHDMRTPLNAIFGFAALAKERIQEPERALKYMERIEAAGKQLLDLIDKVLEVSWEGSKERGTEEECDLCQLLREVCGRLRAKAQEKNLSLTLDCSGVSDSLVWGETEKLRQVAAYLISNAVSYTGPGGRVTVTLSEEGGSAPLRVYHLAVEDTGVGISQEFLERIFEPFAREKNTTHSGVSGMGLGLTIAKYIVDRMGGVIQADSTVGKGSVFTVTLQLRTCGGGETGSGPERTVGPAGLRVLLAEDNEINREIETELMINWGFSVDTAEDGQAALEKLKAAPAGTYDLVLMDIQMPVMDGWQAARVIRSLPDPELAGIPIIALSANGLEGDVRRSLESGMDAHLTKPIDIPRLLEKIRTIVGRRREKQLTSGENVIQ